LLTDENSDRPDSRRLPRSDRIITRRVVVIRVRGRRDARGALETGDK